MQKDMIYPNDLKIKKSKCIYLRFQTDLQIYKEIFKNNYKYTTINQPMDLKKQPTISHTSNFKLNS